jgi:small GTP-binding protein
MDLDQHRPMKIIAIGSVNVGKTSLINRFLSNTCEKELEHTISPSFSSTTIITSDGTKVELQIWDTAGMEKYLGISEMFYRDSDVALLCFDRENVNTIEEWKERVISKAPECLFFLVLTKCDTVPPEDLARTTAEVEALRRNVDAKKCFLTSAHTGYHVRDVFCDAAECVKEIAGPRASANVDIKPVDNKKKRCC